MTRDPGRALVELERLKDQYGPATANEVPAATRKLERLQLLEKRRLHTAQQVLRLHEVLCFLRAYPDSAAVLRQVERMLDGFMSRRDVQQHRDSLVDSGVAGTTIYYSLFWPMARWLAARWPQQLHLDWQSQPDSERLQEALPLLVPASEAGAFDEVEMPLREWIDRLRGGDTDATFVVRRIAALPGDDFSREAFHDGLDLDYRLDAGADTPSRTAARYRVPVTYQRVPLERQRPDLQQAARVRPRRVRVLGRRQATQIIDLARAAMVTRSRDLDVFAYGNPDDVRLVDFGDGLQFACIGLIPERRLLLHAVYGFLTLKNGIPIGYVLASALYGHAGVAYNTFETYRGAEAAFVFGRVLAMTHELFGATAFSIDPYQLGYGNQEGLESGAWWFYYKLGFRPIDAGVQRVLERELKAMRRNPRHRSSIATLQQLSADHVFLHLRGARRQRGLLPLEAVSLGVSRYMAARFGADREAGLRACSTEMSEVLGVGSLRNWTRAERQAWERWCPLLRALPDVDSWSTADKRGVVDVVRAKGGSNESDFVKRFDAHARLRDAVLQFARREWRRR